VTWSFVDNHHLRSKHFRTCDQGSEPPLDDGNESSDDFRCTLGARDKERGRRQQMSAFFTLVGCHGMHVSIRQVSPDHDPGKDRENGERDGSTHAGSRRRTAPMHRSAAPHGCPPPGHLHNYRFRLMALDVARLNIPPHAKCQGVQHAAERHKLAGRINVHGNVCPLVV
jgi:Phosphatidylethanolamine-binding protein